MDLNSILAQLGVGQKETVYLSVTPGVGLELIKLDIPSRSVKNYAYRPLEYNEAVREITDMEAFRTAVTELFAELAIPPKSNVVLNVPMVLFGNADYSLMLGDDAISTALTSEVEQSYIFKRYDPLISWTDSTNVKSGDTRKLYYTAIQKNVVENIKTTLADLGYNLVGLEMSLTSILKALAFSGITEEQMQDGVSWNLMLVSSNGYSVCSMLGKSIIDYYEEPLAIKSFEDDEIYNAISSSAQITFMSYPANYLVVVSETDMVSAELLSKRLPVEANISFIENNSFKKQDVLPVSLDVLEDVAHKISLEAIGIAVGNAVNMPEKFNFFANSSDVVTDDLNEPVHIKIGSNEYDISPSTAIKVSAILSAIIIIPTILAFIGIPAIEKQKQTKLSEVNSKLEQVNSEIKKYQNAQNQSGNFDEGTEIKKVLSNNRSKLMAYSALGESVPKNLWVTYFVTKEDGKIDIKGESKSVEDIYLFFRNMKDSLINTQLRLHKLQMKTGSVDDAVNVSNNYEFEITNMTDAELNPPAPADDKENDEKAQKSDKKDAKEQLPPNKPLINTLEKPQN